MPITTQDTNTEPEYVQQIRRHKEEIAAQIGPLLDAGHALEELAVFLSDGTDRLGSMFIARHSEATEPMVAVFPCHDMALIADNVEPGMGVHFCVPAPRWHIRVLSYCGGKAVPALLKCFPDAIATA